MSVAFEFPPVVDIPPRARAHACGAQNRERLASVTQLHRPESVVVTGCAQLTRRGAFVVGVAVALLAGALLAAAWLSAPEAASGSTVGRVPATVTVRSGDSLWSIAQRIAPNTDPRAEVAVLQRVNSIDGSMLLPGDILRTG